MNIIQWNINGYRSHLEEIKLLINEENPKILCIQETKLGPSHNLTCKGFDTFRYDNPIGEHACGGVLILVDPSLNPQPITLNTTLQVTCVVITFPIRIHICSVYFPPPPFVLSRIDLMNLISQLPEPFLILGDFNAHHVLWGSPYSSPRGNMIAKFLEDHPLILLNDGSPTHLSSGTGNWSHLDLSLSSSSLAPRCDWALVPDLYGSDHAPVRITITCSISQSGSSPRWILERADWNKFQNGLKPVDVDVPLNYLINNIVSYLIASAKDSIPMSSGRRKRRVPWWCEDCSIALRKRRRALRAFSRSPTEENLENYRRMRAASRRMFKKAKKDSWNHYVSTLTRTTSSTVVWRKFRSVCGILSHTPIRYLKNKDDNALVTEPSAVADLLVSAFADVSRSNSYSVRFQEYKQRQELLGIHFTQRGDSPLNAAFSLQELEHAINSSSSSAPGPDNIHYTMLKHLPHSFKLTLLSLYNRVFAERHFPSSWGLSHIIPLLKGGQDRDQPTSYRPISLTSCVCKVMERMVNRRLVWFLESNQLLSREQCGFRQGRSPLDLLISLETSILNSFVQRRQLLAVFFDLKKAYDTAWRRGILTTLHSWGLDGNVLAFVKGFMEDREIQVKLGNTLSSSVPTENGIPQGSVLSCTLFAVAINSITSVITPPVRCSLFVDDFAIFIDARRLATAERALQLCMNRLEDWSSKTGFTFSTEKTCCINFSRLRNADEPQLSLYAQRIRVGQSVKFLGMIFDRRLTWIDHLKALRAKCMKRLNTLKALSGTKWGADRTTMLRFYKAYVRSCLDYGSQVYSSARPSALKMLDSIHHTALRIASGAFRSTPVPSLLSECSEPPLSMRRTYLMISYYFALKSRPDNPAHDVVMRNLLHHVYERRPKAPKPFGARVLSCLDEFHVNDFPIMKNHQSRYPPWLIHTPTFILSLTQYDKHNTSNVVFQQILYENIDSLGPCDVVYTDGSKTNVSTACACVIAGRDLKFPLPPATSVYTAELTAILKALSIVRPKTKRLVICSDSLSSLQAIRDMYSRNILVRDILCLIHDLWTEGTEVFFIWVPSHIGISGNELADKAARAALGMVVTSHNIVASDAKPVARRCIQSAWHTSWAGSVENKLRLIKDEVSLWSTSCRTDRREEVVLCRLRAGHTRLTHGHLMAREEPPACLPCREPLTVEHILVHCQKTARLRRIHGLQHTLREVLADDEAVIQRLFKFLDAAKLLRQI